jgi:hypothetical protein
MQRVSRIEDEAVAVGDQVLDASGRIELHLQGVDAASRSRHDTRLRIPPVEVRNDTRRIGRFAVRDESNLAPVNQGRAAPAEIVGRQLAPARGQQDDQDPDDVDQK